MNSAKKQIGRNLNAALFAILALLWARAAEAQSPAAQRGKTFVLINCARCHSIDKIGASPLAIAPPFRMLHLKYAVESLEESLSEG
jgi:mono/diheme cytochrome c family protein